MDDAKECEQPLSLLDQLVSRLEEKLIEKHGFLLTGESLRDALSYGSLESLRQAIMRRTVPVNVFAIEHRRGKFATARDVARWLAEQQLVADTATKASSKRD